MKIDARAIKDSLYNLEKTLEKITNSRRQLSSVTSKLKKERQANIGMLDGLYRIRQQYIDTIEDFDGEDTTVLSEEAMKEWDVMIQKIQYFEEENKDNDILIGVYNNARALIKEDEAELLVRKRKLEIRLWGKSKSSLLDDQIFGQFSSRRSRGRWLGGRAIPLPSSSLMIKREAQSITEQMVRDVEAKKRKKRQKLLNTFYLIMLAFGSVGAIYLGLINLLSNPLASVLFIVLGLIGGVITIVEAILRTSD